MTRACPIPRAVALLCLLCLFWGCAGGDGPGDRGPIFVDVTVEAGLDFSHDSGASGKLYMPEIMGPGAALFDSDGDGDLDIYLLQGHGELPDPATTSEPRNRFYRREADGGYRDATDASGLGDRGYGMGVAVGDIDNDGDPDVYVSNFGPDRLYRNRGDGTFEDATDRAGIDVDGWSSSAAFLDYDRDGLLDLYVARYVDYDADQPCFDEAGRRDYCSPKVFRPRHDVLLHNEGDGRFIDVSQASGIAAARGSGLGVVCEDLDEDGWIDIYVANDGNANQLWLNRQDGTFGDEALVRGVAYNLNGDAEAGMGVVAADFDGDGSYDLFMTHLRHESNTLYRNLGATGFSDVSGESGLGGPSLAYTGFGTIAGDIDLDGNLDLAIVNGRVQRSEPVEGVQLDAPWDDYAEPNLLYLGDGAGNFAEACASGDAFCESLEITRALAAGDIDGDGDLDLLINNVNGPARLYRNETPPGRHWLGVRAVDPQLGRDANGARVTIEAGGRRQSRTIGGAFSYLSTSDPAAHFGLGNASKVDTLEVRWPDGPTERFSGGAVNRVIVLTRGAGE